VRGHVVQANVDAVASEALFEVDQHRVGRSRAQSAFTQGSESAAKHVTLRLFDLGIRRHHEEHRFRERLDSIVGSGFWQVRPRK